MIVIADPSSQLREDLASRLGPGETTAEVASIAEARDALSRDSSPVRIVILGPGIVREEATRFAEKLEEQHEGVAVLLVSDELDPGLMRVALRSGMDDVLTVGAEASEWQEAIDRARSRVASEVVAYGRGEPSEADKPGRLVTVFSTKGGCGKSLVASNLAILAAEELQGGVALVDLDLQSGDLAIMLQLMPALSIFDASQLGGRLDAEALDGHLTPHHSGMSLLAAPLEPSLAEQVTAESVTRVLSLLRTTHPLTIVDSPALFTDQVLAAIDVSDLIILVASMDVPSIKNLRLATNTLAQLGHPASQLKVVLNRADSKVGLRASEVEKSLGASIDVEIPSSRDVPLSINQGNPLAVSRPKSPIVAAVRKLLPDVLPETADIDRSSNRRRRR